MIIDAHLHLSKEKSEKNFDDAKDRLMKNLADNRISSALLIADNLLGTDCADVETLIRLFNDSNSIFIVGSPNVLNPKDDEVSYLDDLLEKKLIRGLKIFPGHDPIYPTDPRCDEFYRLCLKYNVPMTIHTGINTGDTKCAKYNNPKYIVDIANKYPGLKIIIAHYFWPDMEYCYQVTKSFGNIYYDTSAMADDEVVELSGGLDKISDILERTVNNKPDGVLFGTDYPICESSKHIKLINNLRVAADLKEKIFCLNTRKIFNIFD